METRTTFDLNSSLSLWLAKFAQSPHFRNEDVSEMESHVRDSVTRLNGQGLSEEEAFLIAIRRVGSVAKLEPEYAKQNRNWGNPIVHGLILAFFTAGCWFLWGTLHLPRMMQRMMAKAGGVDPDTGYGLFPLFTQMMISIQSFMLVPPVFALVYCFYVWFRKSPVTRPWMGFFAATAATLIFMTLPTLVAVLLPLIDIMNRLPIK
jgi:hypothetical protein